MFWRSWQDLGATQAQTHAFPSEISRLSRLRKISLYLFLLSGAGGSPKRGVGWVSYMGTRSLPSPQHLGWLFGGWGERKKEEQDRRKVLVLWGVWDEVGV